MIDWAMAALSRAADKSRLWLGVAALMSLTGRRNRRAAVTGLAAVGTTSALVNLVAKPFFARERPVLERALLVRMPTSASYPSGHAASAFAFATAVGAGVPAMAWPLRIAATAVAYSRVHTGVHFAEDVVVGAVVGTLTARLTLSCAGLPRPSARRDR